jgi:hypothetical protein
LRDTFLSDLSEVDDFEVRECNVVTCIEDGLEEALERLSVVTTEYEDEEER